MKPLTEMATAELIAEYNALTGKAIRRFASRAAGERQVNAARARGATPKPTGTVMPASAPKAKKAKVRKVRGKASAEKSGRPASSFTVTAISGGGASKLQAASLRQQLMTWLGGKSATIDRIDEKFGCNMRGVVNKLAAKGWVSKSTAA